MTEIRVSLIYIALEDCGDGRINLKMVPRFPRKFFGHTVNNHNSLREIRQDPCGGVLDTHWKAVCYVRGGDPVKLAKDFVIRVEKFRLEIDRPEPNLEALTREPSVPSTPNIPLGPRNTNGQPWRKPLIPMAPVTGNSPMGNFGSTNIKPNPVFPRVVPTANAANTYKNDRAWALNSVGLREHASGPTTPLRYQRGEESGLVPRARFYAPPPTPAESEGQAEQPQRAQFKVNEILPTLVRKASKDRLPARQENTSMKNVSPISEGRRESPNPMMAALLQGSVPELEPYQERSFPTKGRVEENQSSRMNSIQQEFHRGPMYASPTREYRANRAIVYSTPKSTISSIMSFTPSPVTSSMDTSIGTSDPSPPRTPYWDYKEGMAASWAANRPTQLGLQTNMMGVGDVISKPSVIAASDMNQQCVVLRHKYEQSPGVAVSVRPAPAKSSLAEISVLAAYYWTIPLEELKLYGFFQGEKVSLDHERDWKGYFSVCLNVGDKIIIDVYRERMGGINRCNSEVDCRTIWGPLANLHLGSPRATLPAHSFNTSGVAARRNWRDFRQRRSPNSTSIIDLCWDRNLVLWVFFRSLWLIHVIGPLTENALQARW
ncbi:hypothetical protein BGX38DRAFT_1141172 [Terfezia claveryi]|nr:hypothetical protein BGX38DRAFT_1141172 [Terfezia claveryi]